jgi:hypothetical protein
MALERAQTPRKRRRWRLVLVLLGAGIAALVVLDLLLGLGLTCEANDPLFRHPSSTLDQSLRKSRLVTKLTPSPATVDWHGQQVTIAEAWVEHKTRRLYTFYVPGILFRPIEKTVPGYYLVVTVRQGSNVFVSADDNVMFYRPGSTLSLTHMLGRGEVLAYDDELEDTDAATFHVVLTDSPKGAGKEVVLTPTRAP